MKKIGIFPLAGMILCGMVSLSSGLDYYTRSLLFVIPIVFHVLLYYVVYHFIKVANDKKRQNYSFLISMGACASFFLLFLKFILSGFQNIGNHMLKLANNCYSLGLIVVSDKQEEYAALALFAITGVIAVLSLWLYEKEEKIWISALPSLCLFCIPLALDGVPEEWSIVGYGVSFLLLLCVGKRGTFSKFVLAVGLIAIILMVAILGNGWVAVRPYVREYREQMHMTFQLASNRQEEEQKIQEIDFGKYDKDGFIEYEGLNAVNIYTRTDLRHSIVYLRGFVGNDYVDDQWNGEKQKLGDPMGLAMVQQGILEIQQAADQDIYYGYVMDQEMPKKYGKKKISYTGEEKQKIQQLYLAVDPWLKDNLMNSMNLDPDVQSTIGKAAEKIHTVLQKKFHYTLHPGKSGGSSELETFLFDTKTGYCTHYATAAIMMFRSLGVPARLVQGYMIRGDYVKPTKWTPVYDRNAHAWVEIYIPEAGWYPFDATNGVIAQPGEMGPLEDNPLATPTPLPVVTPTPLPVVTHTPEPEKRIFEQVEEETPKVTGTDSPKQKKSTDLPARSRFQKRIVLGVFLLLFLLAAILIFREVRRKREYRRKIDDFRKQEEWKDKFLWLHSEWEECMNKLEIPCTYGSYVKMIEEFEMGLQRYIPSKKFAEFQENTEFYVKCCFTARYGNESMTEQDFARCEAYLRFVFSAISENEDQKGWKKIRKCCIVDEVMNKKKKVR